MEEKIGNNKAQSDENKTKLEKVSHNLKFSFYICNVYLYTFCLEELYSESLSKFEYYWNSYLSKNFSMFSILLSSIEIFTWICS